MNNFSKDIMLAQLQMKREQVNALIDDFNSLHPDKRLEPISAHVVDLLGVLDGHDFEVSYNNVDAMLTKTANIIKAAKK